MRTTLASANKMTTDASSRWRRPRRISARRNRYALWGAGTVWLVLAMRGLDVNWERLREGVPRGLEFLAAFVRPDFASRWSEISSGMAESLAMTVVATVLGILVSLPVGLGAARNLSPLPVYLFSRGMIALSRGLQEVIVAILFVVMVGFGPLAGVLTLAFATIGFLGKLLAEALETVDRSQVEAMQATGASWWKVLAYGYLPQVRPRFIGLALYRLDINFRESAVIGVVGAGGIGATLNTAFSRYEFDTAAAILILIIAIVFVGETVSGRLRAGSV